MLNPHTWRFYNTFAPWLSATGTLAAVITSLWLARRDRIIRLTISAALKEAESAGIPPLFVITVTNIGHRSATISSVYWKTSGVRTQRIPLTIRLSGNPVRLTDGDPWTTDLAMEFLEKNVDHGLAPILRKSRCPSLTARFIKIGVQTSTGKRFEAHLDASLREWLLKYVALSCHPL
ncbi:MAG: hypothetical protein ACYDDA_13865 [Acidiferrobacteraceae bacterium]